ncbi:hypothetical protein V8E36_007275 [Tilletia maclaganii]
MSNAASSSSAPVPSSSAAPLLAFTESAQRAAGGAPSKKNKKKSKAKESGKTAKIVSALAEARKARTQRGPASKKKKETVAFDEDARRDYLTGFQKRKTERKEAARKVLEDRQRKEMRDSRNAARQERKQRAADNVKAERTALGLESEDDDDEDEAAAEVEPPSAPAEFESEEQHAVVTVESFDPDDPLGIDSQPVPLESHSTAPSASADKIARKRQKIVDSIPASSRRATKKASRQANASGTTSSGSGAGKSKKAKSSTQERIQRKNGGGGGGNSSSVPAAGHGHGAGRLPQRMKAARGLSEMLDSSSRKARAVS